MSQRDGLTSIDQSEAIGPEETTPMQEARSPGPRQAARLRIVYNRDAQESAKNMKPQLATETPKRPRSMLDRNLQVKIGRMLRDVFSDVVEEPVPERFRALLEALEAKEKGQ